MTSPRKPTNHNPRLGIFVTNSPTGSAIPTPTQIFIPVCLFPKLSTLFLTYLFFLFSFKFIELTFECRQYWISSWMFELGAYSKKSRHSSYEIVRLPSWSILKTDFKFQLLQIWISCFWISYSLFYRCNNFLASILSIWTPSSTKALCNSSRSIFPGTETK